MESRPNQKHQSRIMDAIKKKISLHWSAKSKAIEPKRIRWWESPLIRRHYNRMVSGVETEGLLDVAKRKAGGWIFSEGVSVGCGNGWKEMELIRGGLVQFFYLFELSEVRIQHGMELARQLGIDSNSNYGF
jgi:hypothetical protein